MGFTKDDAKELIEVGADRMIQLMKESQASSKESLNNIAEAYIASKIAIKGYEDQLSNIYKMQISSFDLLAKLSEELSEVDNKDEASEALRNFPKVAAELDSHRIFSLNLLTGLVALYQGTLASCNTFFMIVCGKLPSEEEAATKESIMEFMLSNIKH